jgi:hypothetical protein
MSGPFDLDDEAAYRRWREAKLAACPASAAELLVEVANPARLTQAERQALLERVRRTNMAVFAGPPAMTDKETVRALCQQLGLLNLDPNQLADDDGISPLAVAAAGARQRYIPYTDRPISWHTDGYYNEPERHVQGLVLVCARPAAEGGDNDLYDHELAYIALRDQDPALIRALMRLDAMTIPGNEDGEMMGRPIRTGPVFSLNANGSLHMRYTARTRSIVWSDDSAVQAAVAALEGLLASSPPGMLRHRLEAGQGLVSNNVLHTRAAFRDDPARPRLLWRARFYDRIEDGP